METLACFRLTCRNAVQRMSHAAHDAASFVLNRFASSSEPLRSDGLLLFVPLIQTTEYFSAEHHFCCGDFYAFVFNTVINVTNRSEPSRCKVVGKYYNTYKSKIFRYMSKSVSFDTLSLSWLREPDLNQRPSGYEPDELPDCSTPHQSRTRIIGRFYRSVNTYFK